MPYNVNEMWCVKNGITGQKAVIMSRTIRWMTKVAAGSPSYNLDLLISIQWLGRTPVAKVFNACAAV